MKPAKCIETGWVERIPLDTTSPYWYEHCSRYYFAVPYIRSKIVLDIACGNGYGTYIMAKNRARFVIGVDISQEAITTARRNFSDVNMNFKLMDAAKTDFVDKAFNVVTSFETIEHIPDYIRFLMEIRRLIKDNGVLLISTPNSLITIKRNGKPDNPYHAKEFTPDEFYRLLSGYFRFVRLYGQILTNRGWAFDPLSIRNVRTVLAVCRP
jgi:2-polyprenyl-3-methyl-5-hydroxy-6-metoxy-1,4-benzoquinol methylase